MLTIQEKVKSEMGFRNDFNILFGFILLSF